MIELQSYDTAVEYSSEHQPATTTHCQYMMKDHSGYGRPIGYGMQRPSSERGNKHYFAFLFLQMSL
jgi:hypothetical protein